MREVFTRIEARQCIQPDEDGTPGFSVPCAVLARTQVALDPRNLPGGDTTLQHFLQSVSADVPIRLSRHERRDPVPDAGGERKRAMNPDTRHDPVVEALDRMHRRKVAQFGEEGPPNLQIR